MNNNLFLMQTSISNINIKYVTKYSIRGADNNVILIVNAHFVEVDEESIDVRNQLKEVKPETPLHDLIMSSHGGGGGVPVQPELRTSTDYCAVFIFCGNSMKKDPF